MLQSTSDNFCKRKHIEEKTVKCSALFHYGTKTDMPNKHYQQTITFSNYHQINSFTMNKNAFNFIDWLWNHKLVEINKWKQILQTNFKTLTLTYIFTYLKSLNSTIDRCSGLLRARVFATFTMFDTKVTAIAPLSKKTFGFESENLNTINLFALPLLTTSANAST